MNPIKKLSQQADEQDWRQTDSWVRFGLITLAAFVGLLLILSIALSVSGAVIASGTVTVEGSYQAVQHREGGIVAKIPVKNGDLVAKGQLLVELDPTAARAALTVTTTRITELLIEEARLKAERDGADIITLPASLRARIDEPGLRAIAKSQSALWRARRNAFKGEQALLAQQIRQNEEQQAGLRSQLAATSKELRLTRETLAATRRLFNKGYSSRQQLITVERDAARLAGETGRLEGAVSANRSAIAEARLRLAQSKKAQTEKIVDELRQLRSKLNELEETRKTQADQLNRIRIRAPRAGFVHDLKVHTIGGVIAPGSTLAQIIPVNRDLLIEARIRPADIDKLHQGGQATIRFPAFNTATTPALQGTLSTVSAAQLDDDRTGSYFSALIALAPDEINKIPQGQRLVPGMPAEVFIKTESRSVLSYLLKPLMDAMSHSMR